MAGHRKRVRHYHEPGDCHELTFSCYRRMPLLTNDVWRKMLSVSVDRAVARHRFQTIALVYMPEHVHLLVCPPASATKQDVDRLLYAIKRPFSYRIKTLLAEAGSPLLQKLTVQERPGKSVFRFWQEGPGYDRNISTPQALLAAIEYIHNNPLRRGLCRDPLEWKWSSCRFYCRPEEPRDGDLPWIHGIPQGALDGRWHSEMPGVG